jgi:Metallopeptidase family M24
MLPGIAMMRSRTAPVTDSSCAKLLPRIGIAVGFEAMIGSLEKRFAGNILRLISAALGTLVLATVVVAGTPAVPLAPAQGRRVESAADYVVLPPHERVQPENEILKDRLEHLLPALMSEAGLDMWLVVNREYAEDPVYFTLVPQPSFAARRTTMLVFSRAADGTVERLAVNRYPLGDPYKSAWSGGDLDAQWKALGALIAGRDPKRIGIDVSRNWPAADGLTHALHERLVEVLPAGYAQRLVPAEKLVIRWIETRTAAEQALYPHIDSITRGVIAEAFSGRVITPGVTTTDDVAWYIRERFESLGLRPWFMATVDRQRASEPCSAGGAHCGGEGRIEAGDVLHTDVGFCYLKLCTDTQEMGYVLKADEEAVPAGLKAALASGNRWQDILTGSFKEGRPGNEILATTIKGCEAARLICSTYSHPLGFFGHSLGPTIGMWDNQGPTPVNGDYPLHKDTVYAIEGNVTVSLPEWGGHPLQIMLEQDALFDGKTVLYLAGRQTEWHVIR